ncbi:hypothetical protein [Halobacillus sp. BBL2006]|uniref:sunset domain-containing protein n=1 Tax=Halobacillus sp. BBL2006 TaxID=1543706 RepID=UPI00054275C6|nr:hypothetical protein [Halobacillus sp. BBL2006]KHE68738.1 hypothetical protein LD39_14030 [Halobacillus sp. BBL2006]
MKPLQSLLSKGSQTVKSLYFIALGMIQKLVIHFKFPGIALISKKPKISRQVTEIVKGHTNAHGELIYYVQGDPGYEDLDHAVVFISKYEAEKSGYRRWNY